MKPYLSVPSGYKKHDSHAPDGITSEGFRVVRLQGCVKFAGVWWHHEALKDYEGETVFCQGQDYLQQEMSVYSRNFKFITKVTPVR